MWASRSNWPKPPTPSTPTPTTSPLVPGSSSSRGKRGQGATTPIPHPFSLPTATRSPAALSPQDKRNMESPEETGQGEMETHGEVTGQGRAHRARQNGAGHRRRQRKREKGKNHCGYWKPLSGKLSCKCTHQRAQVSAGFGKPSRCIWMHLVNGTGSSPSLGQPTPE